MNGSLLIAALSALAASAAPGPSTAGPSMPANHVSGDYVEVRTASVFAGACHYNGELLSCGRDALLAIDFSKGTWNGVDLAGVKVAAEVSASDNLGNAHATRKTELVIDASASNAQAAAVVNLLDSTYAASLGQIVSTRRAAIAFEHQDRSYHVAIESFGAVDVDGMPNDECCKQPNLVWYSPLIPLTNRKVGYTESASYDAGKICDPWQRGDENSAFYGQFAF